MKLFVVYCFYCVILSVNGLFEGDVCTKNNKQGVCKAMNQCESAIRDIKEHRIRPEICTFNNAEPIVCCFGENLATTSQRPVATTTKPTPTTTTEQYVPPEYEYKYDDRDGQPTRKTCKPISMELTSAKTGKKAFDKCIEYQESLVYPCKAGVDFLGSYGRANHCHHNADELIIGGEDAAHAEFPHMVLLGYGTSSRSAQWLCGGSLISEKFILTAGHCTYSRDGGSVAFARLSLHNRSEIVSDEKIYDIKRIVKHPEYKPPIKYNDIALLETSNPIVLDQYTVPACLDLGQDRNDARSIATGWGLVKYKGDNANTLQKVQLNKFQTSECKAHYPSQRNMKEGFVEATQMCYGDKEKSRDTCQGDSGGPLQIKSAKIHCMYVIVGVTSFGKGCGFINEPGIYTRVSAYVDWIENIVWP